MRCINKIFYKSKRKRLRKGEIINVHPGSTLNARFYVTKDCSVSEPRFRRLQSRRGYNNHWRYKEEPSLLIQALESGNFIVENDPQLIKLRIKGVKRQIQNLGKLLTYWENKL